MSVFRIPELLHKILQFVDLDTCEKIGKVSRLWHSVSCFIIQKSILTKGHILWNSSTNGILCNSPTNNKLSYGGFWSVVNYNTVTRELQLQRHLSIRKYLWWNIKQQSYTPYKARIMHHLDYNNIKTLHFPGRVAKRKSIKIFICKHNSKKTLACTTKKGKKMLVFDNKQSI